MRSNESCETHGRRACLGKAAAAEETASSIRSAIQVETCESGRDCPTLRGDSEKECKEAART
eukprot:7667647-Prorocentrum_lima.AAC.1